MENVTRLVGETLAQYWPDITIYSEQQEDGFIEPSFFVHRINLAISPEFTGYQKRRYAFQVVYFPGADNINAKLDQMAEALAGIKVIAGFAHLSDVEIKPGDNVLLWDFNLNIRAKPVTTPTLQKQLDYTGGLENGD